jgi:hypothetical protein
VPNKIEDKLLLYCRKECCLCDKKVSGKYEKNTHHINNDPSDNNYDNLIILCPNCHAIVTRGDFDRDELKLIKEAKIKKLGIKDFIETDNKDAENIFKEIFNDKIEYLENLITTHSFEADDKIDEIIMMIKEKIDKWDIPSVKYSTEQLFLKLYKYSEDNGFCEMYYIFKDLFDYAYTQRKKILFNMIYTFNNILMSSWVPDYDIDKGEKTSKILLRLGIDYLHKDIEVSESCIRAIDNLAGDMFEPEILSKQIIFCAALLNQKNKKEKYKQLLEDVTQWIEINDQYSWDAERYDYLISSIDYAESEQEIFGINVYEYKEKYINQIINSNINENINGFIDFLSEFEPIEEIEDNQNNEKESLLIKEIDDSSFNIETLVNMILNYKQVRPNIDREIFEIVKQKNSPELENVFNNLIQSNNYLRKVYGRDTMITTFDELMFFLKKTQIFLIVKLGSMYMDFLG